MKKKAQPNPMQAALDEGEQFQRDVVKITENMTDEQRSAWCAEMDAYRGITPD